MKVITVPDFKVTAYRMEWAKTKNARWRVIESGRTHGQADITVGEGPRGGVLRVTWIDADDRERTESL